MYSSVKLRKPAHSAAITKPASAQGSTIMRLRESRTASNAFLRSKNTHPKNLFILTYSRVTVKFNHKNHKIYIAFRKY